MKSKHYFEQIEFIIVFIIGGVLVTYLYLLLFPTYHGSIQADYFPNYLQVQENINLSDFTLLQAKGTSMIPTIQYNSFVVIDNDTSNLKVGDIITFINPDLKSRERFYYITHRIIKIKEKDGEIIYLTRGDNVKYRDGYWISKGQIYGKVVGVLY